MRSYTGVLIGNLIFSAVCCIAGPIFLAVGISLWHDGAGADRGGALTSLGIGLFGTAAIPVVAVVTTRKEFPRITRGDRVKSASASYADDSFVMWTPTSPQGQVQAQLARADVLEASLVRYQPDGEATFTTHFGDYVPDEFTPLIRLRLRVRGVEPVDAVDAVEGVAEGAPGQGEFEVTGEWRVPSLCLSAITAGRLVVLVHPAASVVSEGPAGPADTTKDPRKVTAQWSRSVLLAGTRTSRLVDLDGRLTDVTRRPGRLLEQMRISRSAGDVELVGDMIDLRRLSAETAARYAALAERTRADPEDQAPLTEPGEESRWLVDELPGDSPEFGSVGRRWSRRGGHLVRARFLEMRGTTTFQDHGPVLDTVLRIHPADGTPPFDAARRLTVPMNYLAVLHRTRDVVLHVSPSGSSYVVDWARTNLLAGVAPAKVIAPDATEHPLTGRPDLIWSLMNLLASQGLSNPTPVLDLRKRRLSRLTDPVLRVVTSGASGDFRRH